MSDIKTEGGAPEISHAEKGAHHVDDSHNLDLDAKAIEYKMAAMEAEAAEIKMGVLQAVKEYPMAATWAFIMSCTIVSNPHNSLLSCVSCFFTEGLAG